MDTTRKFDLYKLLRVSRTSSQNEIKRSFFILAKKIHPDKNKEDPSAKENFQTLRRAYDILKDKEKRDLYDKTGCIDEESQAYVDAYARFRGVKITKEDIEAYEKSFKGSEEEKKDLEEYFIKKSGNVTNILGSIIGAVNSDRERFIEFYTAMIASKSFESVIIENFNASKGAIRTIEELDNLEEDICQDEQLSEGEEEEEIQNEMKGFIVQDTKQMVKDVLNDSDADSEVEQKGTLREGELVKAKWKGGIKYYRGIVKAVSQKANLYTIEFADGAVEEDVRRELIRKIEAKVVKPAKCKAKVIKNATKKKKIFKKGGKKRKKSENLDDLRAAILGNRERRLKEFDKFAQKYIG